MTKQHLIEKDILLTKNLKRMEREIQSLQDARRDVQRRLAATPDLIRAETNSSGNLELKGPGWAATVFTETSEAAKTRMGYALGQSATMFLADCLGKWYDESGHLVSGYLYYKPNKA